MTVRKIFLWSVSFVNLSILFLAIWLQSDILVWISCLCSVVVIFIQKKLTNDVKRGVKELSVEPDRVEKEAEQRKTNRQKAHKCQEESRAIDQERFGRKNFYHTRSSKKENESQVKIGSSQCWCPSVIQVLGFEKPENTCYKQSEVSALELASWMEGFAYSTNFTEVSINHLDFGKKILKFPVNHLSNNLTSLKDNAKRASVCGIELVLSKPDNETYLLSELIGSEENPYFNNTEELLNFVHHLRKITGGKPIGVRTEIGTNIDILELCFWMKKTGILMDFISVEGRNTPYLSSAPASEKSSALKYVMSLEDGVSFVSKVLQQYHFEKEIKIIAAGHLENSMDLTKTLSYGADACLSTNLLSKAFEKSIRYYYEDSDSVLFSNLIFINRRINKEYLTLIGSEDSQPVSEDINYPAQNFMNNQSETIRKIFKNCYYHLN